MFTRRQFLLNSALLGSAAMFLPACATPRKPRKIGANEKLNVAVVGAGGRGYDTVRAIGDLAKNANLVALCDVDDERAAPAFKRYPNAKRFRDYRVMLDKMDKEIDAVVVATPDHMHYPIAAWAISKGKHVYCEKPLTRTIWEAHELKRLAKEAGVITQMGNQGHTNEGWRVIREWYNAGLLGEIKDIYMWTNRPIWPQGGLKMPAGEKVPDNLDYKVWLGVAPYQPYSSKVLPFNWRGLRNYGTGAAGDMACHFFDVPYSAFELGAPVSIQGKASPFDDCTWPAATKVEMTFANKCGLGGKINLHWSDAKVRPQAIERVDPSFLVPDPQQRMAQRQLHVHRGHKRNGSDKRIRAQLDDIPARKNEGIGEVESPARKDYYAFHRPRKSAFGMGKELHCGTIPPGNFDYAAPFTEMCLLSMISINFPEQKLEYDAKTMSFKNCKEADKYIRSLYAYNEEFLPSKSFWSF